jgi:sortase A
MMKNKCGIVMMAVGLLLLAGALGWTGYNIITERRAEASSAQTVAILQQQIPGYLNADDQHDNFSQPNEASVTEMQSLDIAGQECIGVLDIPCLELSLPVQKDWSYPQLNDSPCRYQGSFLDGSLIIAGHNYQKHFGKLSQLNSGDRVIFTDVAGNVYSYAVTSVDVLAKTDVAAMEAGNWDLTLFTCTPGGLNRVTVRCARMN